MRSSSVALEPAPRRTCRTGPVDEAVDLARKLSAKGVASLNADKTYLARQNGDQTESSLRVALQQVGTDPASGKPDSLSESASEEDYDTIRQDPQALKTSDRGFTAHDDTAKILLKAHHDSQSSNSIKQRPIRLRSIPATLKKSTEKGRYVLTATDGALKELLRSSVEREQNPKTAKRRTKFSDLVFTRQFTTFDRNNVESTNSPFHGFFVLFWLAIAFMILRIAHANWRESGNVLGSNEIMAMMFHREVLVLAISDGVLCSSTGFGYLLQTLILNDWLDWNAAGWIVQSVWELFYLVVFVGWTLFREWPWSHTVFFVLHGLIMLMKQHSYCFYLGHLSEAYKTRKVLYSKLKQLNQVITVDTPSATTPSVTSLSTSYLEHRPTQTGLSQRRQHQRSNSVAREDTNISQVATAIESGEPLDADQIRVFKRIIIWEIDALTEELKGKATQIDHYYPYNLTLANHYEYIVLPTLVYELEYPRSNSISWSYVAEKSMATFGILMIMNMVSQAYIYPIVVDTIRMKEAGLSLQERLDSFPLILGDLIFPFLLEFLMSWYIIWECILNVLGELTYFADRGFYADWWNSVSWDQYARDWNRPVHNFLLRHVYHSSISSMQVDKYTATVITFFLSAIVHELVMWCLFKKLRGYLLLFQMCQVPLIQMSRSRWLKGRATLGNLIFWIGVFTGPSLLCSLYLII